MAVGVVTLTDWGETVVVGAIAIGRMLAVALETADDGWFDVVCGRIAAGEEAIGRMLAVLGDSDTEIL